MRLENQQLWNTTDKWSLIADEIPLPIMGFLSGNSASIVEIDDGLWGFYNYHGGVIDKWWLIGQWRLYYLIN